MTRSERCSVVLLATRAFATGALRLRLVRHPLALRRVVSLIIASAVSMPVLAQRWTIEPSLSSQLTWTSNSSLGAAGAADDTVLSIRPTISIRGDGARLKLSGTATLNGIAYFEKTQPSRVLPEGDVQARLEAVERFLFLEAGVRASRTSANPFGVRTDSSSTTNTVTTTQARFSPSIEATIGPLTRYRIRSDNTWTTDATAESSGTAASAAAGAAGYFGRHAVALEHDPRPLGWRVEGERSQTRYTDGVTDPLTSDVARFVVDYALVEDFSAGVRAGYERNSFVNSDNGRQSIYGVQAKWQPSARTLVSADAERRYFGSAWRLGIDHRTPQLAISFTFARGLQSAPQSLFEIPAAGNVAALLDAMFTTRFPDPAERARIVQKFISDQGLPSSTLGATSIYSQRLSLVTTRSASIGLIGSRNSIVFSGFYTRTEDVPDSTALVTGAIANNNLQYGLGMSFSHRLAQSVSLTAAADWSRIRALDASGGGPTTTTQAGANVQLNLQVSPKTGAVVGGRYRKLESNLAVPGREGSVYMGVNHKF
jgi:uncharacterized protein (PEP-CTERM system associated)